LNYFYSNVEVSKDGDMEKMLKSHSATLGKFNTIINHLERLPKTWELLHNIFRSSKTVPNLTHTEINFAEFRTLEDDDCFLLYIYIMHTLFFYLF